MLTFKYNLQSTSKVLLNCVKRKCEVSVMQNNTMRDVIRANLRSIMETRCVRNVDLANAIGVSKSTVTNWMSGRNSIDIDLVPRICAYLDVDISALLNDSADYSHILNKNEMHLINTYRRMDGRARRDLIRIADAIAPQN